MNLIKIIFWSSVSVIVALIVARLILGFAQRFNVTAGVARGIEGLAGIAS